MQILKSNLIKTILVILIIAIPAFSYTGCKKQKKCGCGKDVLFTYTNQPAYVYFSETGSIMYMSVVGDPYSTYHFCNPAEMFEEIKDYKSGDELLVSGYAYWECNYVFQSSNNNYQTSLYKVYNFQATKIFLDMYGKK